MLLPWFILSHAILVGGSPKGAGTPARTAQVVTCSFANKTYSGLCAQDETVEPGTRPEAACVRILACLNNQTCIKTYRNATTIRRGWRLVSAQVGPSPRPKEDGAVSPSR